MAYWIKEEAFLKYLLHIKKFFSREFVFIYASNNSIKGTYFLTHYCY